LTKLILSEVVSTKASRLDENVDSNLRQINWQTERHKSDCDDWWWVPRCLHII